MPAIIAIIFLYLFFCLAIRYCLRNKAFSLSLPEIMGAFGFKVLMGCVYGFVFWRFYHGDDTWALHEEGIVELKEWIESPGKFFKDLQPLESSFTHHGFPFNILVYLQLAEHFVLRKLLALFNILSGGNYYVNVVFFNFILFWGHYLLFSLLAAILPHKRNLLFLVVFFFPPAVFWLSGIRADGLLFLFVSLSLVHAFRWIHLRKKVSLAFLLLSLLGVLIFRTEAVVLLLPGLIAWYWVERSARLQRVAHPNRLAFLIVYGVSGLLFFGSLLVSDHQNLPSLAVKRQQEFMLLKGNTRFDLDSLQPSVGSFVRILPQAAGNTFLRPFPWEAKGPLQAMAVLENGLLLLLLVLIVFRRDQNVPVFRLQPLWWVLLCFSVCLYLMVGYIVPFPGAIVRYKIIPELFLLILLASGVRLKPNGGLLSAR